ncbi:hypothetical protein PanWU01x14_306700, partial [Parasponia andersonii]
MTSISGSRTGFFELFSNGVQYRPCNKGWLWSWDYMTQRKKVGLFKIEVWPSNVQ